MNGIQHLGERDRSLAQLAGALPRLNPEQCIMVFDAVLRPVAWQRDIGRLHDLCSGLGVLNNDRRSLLFNAVLALPPANPSTPFVVAELAGQIAHLSPAQVDLVNEMAASSGIGLTMLIRGRSVARGEQRRHIDSKNIVETALTRNQADWIHGLSQVTELLNDEECRRCAEAALALGVEPLKADAVAAAGQALHRLPEPLRETLIQAAESMADPKNKVEAVVGLSRGMAHLSPRQCERLFEVGRSASPNGRFDHHNIRALEALVTAEWPWSARWDRPHPPQRQPNPDQVSRAPETV
ncbi:MAG TPA: hypothetical protein VFP68_14095 [Burkholderiaceae bacterium]|nr:hypothetical protein [Burkholderiaceae bacterium]